MMYFKNSMNYNIMNFTMRWNVLTSYSAGLPQEIKVFRLFVSYIKACWNSFVIVHAQMDSHVWLCIQSTYGLGRITVCFNACIMWHYQSFQISGSPCILHSTRWPEHHGCVHGFETHGPHAFSWQTGNSRAKHTPGCRGRIYSSHLSTDSTASFPWWWGLEWWDGFGFSPPRPSRCGHLCACVDGRSTPEESWSRWRKWEWVAGWCSWWLMACNCSDSRLRSCDK